MRRKKEAAMSGSQQIAENLVIGGGPAGSMLAMRLADAGRQVTLLEKERVAHHKVCGEFLSREAVGYLRQAGIEPRELGATAIRIVRLTSGRRTATSTLPFEALSLSRYVLDAAMLAQAHFKGCEVRRGASVEALTKQGDTWLVRLRNGQSISARTVFLANGKHDLHGWERADGKQCDLVGFKMHWRLSRTSTRVLREVMDLFLFDGGYGGLSLIEDDVANLCLVVRRSNLRKIGGWEQLIAGLLCENPHMLQRMQDAEAMWERPLAISSIPYGYLTQRSGGVWCVGDQAAVIPSFTGDGMSIALHSGALAAEMYLAGKSAEAFHNQLHKQLERGMSLATALSRAMVTRAGRNFAPLILALFPNAMRWIAASTRIPEPALCHGTADVGIETTLRKSQIA
jgi:menaquinone-9 beta-reductase